MIINRTWAFAFIFAIGCEADDRSVVEPANVEHGNVCIDLSPDGASVVFSSANGDLFLFDLSTKFISRLTESSRIESCPSFSPNGRQVVFAASSDINGPFSIFAIDISTRKTVRLTKPTNQSDFFPRYSPDGKRIVFGRAHRDRPYSLGGRIWDNWDVCEMAADGNACTRLTRSNYNKLGRIVPRSDTSLIYAASASVGKDRPPAGLYYLKHKEKPRLLIPTPHQLDGGVNAWANDPMISGDGAQMAFVSDRNKLFRYDVCVTDAKNKAIWLVVKDARSNRFPDFFPDGKRILFLAGTKIGQGNRPIYSLWEGTLAGKTREIATSDLFSHPERWQPKNIDPK